jgi:hypothetical protein
MCERERKRKKEKNKERKMMMLMERGHIQSQFPAKKFF